MARSAAKQREFHSPAAPGASGTYFAGGLTINVSDLGKLVALLANDGQYEGLQMMKPESVALMEAVNETQLPDGSYQGLSIRCRKDIYGRERLYFHTGSAYGVYNCMSYDPDTGDGVVVLTVGASAAKDSNGIYAVCGEISHEILQCYEEVTFRGRHSPWCWLYCFPAAGRPPSHPPSPGGAGAADLCVGAGAARADGVHLGGVR